LEGGDTAAVGAAGEEDMEGLQASKLRYRWRVAEVAAAVVTRGYTVVLTAPTVLWTRDALLTLQEKPEADVQVRREQE
jgi:hypothetical protein